MTDKVKVPWTQESTYQRGTFCLDFLKTKNPLVLHVQRLSPMLFSSGYRLQPVDTQTKRLVVYAASKSALPRFRLLPYTCFWWDAAGLFGLLQSPFLRVQYYYAWLYCVTIWFRNVAISFFDVIVVFAVQTCSRAVISIVKFAFSWESASTADLLSAFRWPYCGLWMISLLLLLSSSFISQINK